MFQFICRRRQQKKKKKQKVFHDKIFQVCLLYPERVISYGYIIYIERINNNTLHSNLILDIYDRLDAKTKNFFLI